MDYDESFIYSKGVVEIKAAGGNLSSVIYVDTICGLGSQSLKLLKVGGVISYCFVFILFLHSSVAICSWLPSETVCWAR